MTTLTLSPERINTNYMRAQGSPKPMSATEFLKLIGKIRRAAPNTRNGRLASEFLTYILACSYMQESFDSAYEKYLDDIESYMGSLFSDRE